MEIKNKLYKVTLTNDLCYYVVSKTIEDALYILKKWRDDISIKSINLQDDIVLTKEEVYGVEPLCF